MMTPAGTGWVACAAMAALIAGTVPVRAAALNDIALPWPWALPFVGLVLSIALAPLLLPRLWHGHYGKIAYMWSVLTLAPLAALYGIPTAVAAFVKAMVGEYMGFILLLAALYVVGGGIRVIAGLRGTPLVNTAILALGTLMASLVGTTGAAMILIQPLLRANAHRLNSAHVVVFFIFLVGNIGGALLPLGDPPLFVGFLHGVDFFWTAIHLWRPTLLTAALVLAIFVAVDLWYHRLDRRVVVVGEKTRPEPIRVSGLVNLILIGGIIAASAGLASWQSDISLDIQGTALNLRDVVRDVALVVIIIASLMLSPEEHRECNGFSWGPLGEVAILFAGIFICMIPVTMMLERGWSGPFAAVLALMTDEAGAPRNAAYFWLTGVLSAFLDNAPTYLMSFGLAGGDARKLMGELAPTLMAISMGAVYMGALTYIGNAPNLMIHAIATERGVKMPGFLGYMAWSGIVLLPVFAIVTYVFFVRT